MVEGTILFYDEKTYSYLIDFREHGKWFVHTSFIKDQEVLTKNQTL